MLANTLGEKKVMNSSESVFNCICTAKRSNNICAVASKPDRNPDVEQAVKKNSLKRHVEETQTKKGTCLSSEWHWIVAVYILGVEEERQTVWWKNVQSVRRKPYSDWVSFIQGVELYQDQLSLDDIFVFSRWLLCQIMRSQCYKFLLRDKFDHNQSSLTHVIGEEGQEAVNHLSSVLQLLRNDVGVVKLGKKIQKKPDVLDFASGVVVCPGCHIGVRRCVLSHYAKPVHRS